MPAADCRESVAGLERHDHACWIRRPDGPDHDAALVSYLAAGLAGGERVAFYGASEARVQRVTAHVRRTGPAAETMLDGGRPVWHGSHRLPGGALEPEDWLDAHADAVQAALADGFTGLRLAVEMPWLPGPCDRFAAWRTFEFAAGMLAIELPLTALCVYDAAAWPPAQLAVLDALHPRRVGDRLADEAPGIRVHARRAGAGGTPGAIAVCGTVDALNAPQLTELLHVAAHRSRVPVLDLSGLRSFDTAGMRAIATTGRILTALHGSATVIGASPAFRRIWRLAGFDLALPTMTLD